MAGLIKVVLAMQHHLIPANLNFKTPNPDIAFEALKLEVQKEATPWPAKQGETYKAGINSFGWGGTNAHAVLEQYVNHQDVQKAPQASFALPLSAKSPQALLAYAKQYAALLEACDDDKFRSVCIATALVKAELDHRHLFSGTSREELLAELNLFIADQVDVSPAASVNKKKVVFVFPGQGAQWLGMGRDAVAAARPDASVQLHRLQPPRRACPECVRHPHDASRVPVRIGPCAGRQFHNH
jgi:acyl transferase domain-containing protein